ncbi:MAG: hypothetical protein B7Y31_13125, partial [Novosphingobium sp. 16-62-11]
MACATGANSQFADSQFSAGSVAQRLFRRASAGHATPAFIALAAWRAPVIEALSITRVHMRANLRQCPAPGTCQAKDCSVVTKTTTASAINARHQTRKFILRGIMIGAMAVLATGCGKKERPKADLAASQITTIGV